MQVRERGAPAFLVVSQLTTRPGSGEIEVLCGRGIDGKRFALTPKEVIGGIADGRFRLLVRQQGSLTPIAVLAGDDGRLCLVEGGQTHVTEPT